jgi:CRISPR-associated protein Cst2
MSRGLTLSIIFQSQSLNYGEGTGNISELKKLSRDHGVSYTYASRQALRYDIVRLGMENFAWTPPDLMLAGEGTKKTVQFAPEATIENSPEIDLFGYFKTERGEASTSRSAIVRLNPAISMEPFLSDMEFLSNKGLSDRMSVASGKDVHPNLAQFEQHLSFYSYTLAVDLDEVGVDGDVSISKEERINRVTQLLEIIKVLNRHIKGRIENLSPLFLIGGLYDIKNPFFMGRLKLAWRGATPIIKTEPIKDTLTMKYNGKSVGDSTYMGYVSGIWANEEEMKQLAVKKASDVETIFGELIKEVKEHYDRT